MKFKLYCHNNSFIISFAESTAAVNYIDMPGGNYDWQKDIIYDSLTAVKKELRSWLRNEKFNEMNRYHLRQRVNELNIETLIDAELESYERLQAEFDELEKKLENIKSKKEVSND